MASARTVTVILLAWGVAALYIYAGVLKLVQPDVLLADIRSYHLAPYRLAYIGAFALPALEIASGVALLFSATRREAALLLGALTAMFTLALISAWVRGLDISCGCFGKSETAANYPWLIGRDLVILAACIAILRLATRPTPK